MNNNPSAETPLLSALQRITRANEIFFAHQARLLRDLMSDVQFEAYRDQMEALLRDHENGTLPDIRPRRRPRHA